MSVDPGVQPDDPNVPNRILIGGLVDIDYLKKFPNYREFLR